MSTPAKLFSTTNLVDRKGPWVTVDGPAAVRVVKVGGSLLRSARDYALVAEALAHHLRAGPAWIVVSAAKGMTDALEQVAAGAEDPAAVMSWHERLAESPSDPRVAAQFEEAVAAAADGRPEPILAWGEQASAAILARHLARLGHALPVVELAPSKVSPSIPSAIVPGFYVRGAGDRLHVLPRGGSDISAVLVASWVGAAAIHLWKEGGGLRLEPGITVERVDAATALQWLGDRVRPIHPAAIRLARRLGVPLVLEDPFGVDGATTIEVAPTASSIPPAPVRERVAGEATP